MIDTRTSIAEGGAVLAGGSSRRMGSDKATIVIDGHTMLERCLNAMSKAGLSPRAVIGGTTNAGPPDSTLQVDDQWPGEGPLGALVTALDNIESPVVVVMACDFLDPSAIEIRRLCAMLEHYDAVVPVAEGRDQWLHSVWKRSCRHSLRDAFESGTRSIHAATAGLNIRRVAVPDPVPYHDADTPDDLPLGHSGREADREVSCGHQPGD